MSGILASEGILEVPPSLKSISTGKWQRQLVADAVKRALISWGHEQES